MKAAASLLPELEEVIQHGTPARRAEALRRITGLFLEGADTFKAEHVALFDDVMGYLIEEIEAKARAELAHRLAPVENAPYGVIRKLANDDNIAVAEPVLKRSNLPELDLVKIAKSKSQAHLLALSGRTGIGQSVTDILANRGDREVARNLANNADARISDNGFTTLVKRAEKDGVLAERVGLRQDIPPRLFRDLLIQATEVVQQRLLAKAKPETQAEIKRVLSKVSREIGAKAAPRNYTSALQIVRAMQKAGKLTEQAVADFAAGGTYEETIAALSILCGVPVDVVDRLMNGDRPDPALILSRAIGFKWETARKIICSRQGVKPPTSQVIEAAKENFDKLTAPTAQRVVRFWQVRQGYG